MEISSSINRRESQDSHINKEEKKYWNIEYSYKVQAKEKFI